MNNFRIPAWWLAIPVVLACIPRSTIAQATPPPERIRVFLDCRSPNCDSREFRTELSFVDWVTERTVADVHVLMTSQDAGTGRQYILDFIGQGEFAETQTRLEHIENSTDTRDETLTALTRLMGAGLVGFVAERGYASDLEIRAADIEEGAAPPPRASVDDPWDLWVFSIGGNASANGEERETEERFSLDFNANRTTADWKMSAGIRLNINRREVELNDGGTFTDNSDDWFSSALLARSISEHVSVGSVFEANSSTDRNRDYGGRIATALEWSYYPYSEANRRQLVVHHQLGISSVNYTERTIFDQLAETYTDQRIAVSYDTRQPWGSLSVSADYSNLLRDFSKYSYSMGGSLNFRIFRGLDLRVNGRYEVIRDQIYLASEGLTDEEILVQRGDLATGYEYNMGVGFNFSFGSIFNNVVNNRFPGSVRN